ncbi:hypothetical protein KFE25_002692 [Diacronema lutheri]|uniref:MAT1 centre domain-containing protein n=1 Tax=Diacronema lutheri TaxID=2081491 RepID=A0A8J5XTY4_DIALT|nr:hypothetical protein KFE25_002692 [Diacronema lutheri]
MEDVRSLLDPFKKEAKFRDEVLAVYYKVEEDFESSEQYDDYLMEVEDMIHALCHGEDVLAVRAKLAEYKRKWGELSAVNRSRRAEGFKQVCAADERERLEFAQRCAEKLELEKRRLAGLQSEKQRAQLNIANGRPGVVELPRAAVASTTSATNAHLLSETDLFVDPGALPARMREKKQETSYAASRSQPAASEAAALAAGCSQRALLQAAQAWAFQLEALTFVPVLRPRVRSGVQSEGRTLTDRCDV